MICETCNDTGYYGDNGPGIIGNREYQPCDQCGPTNKAVTWGEVCHALLAAYAAMNYMGDALIAMDAVSESDKRITDPWFTEVRDILDRLYADRENERDQRRGCTGESE